MKILVLNSGSSSQKCSLFEISQAPSESPGEALWDARFEWDGDFGELEIKKSGESVSRGRREVTSRREAIKGLIQSLWEVAAAAIARPSEIDFVGHRVVHGGAEFEEPTVITPRVKEAIRRLSAFAPLHNRAELEGVEMIEELLGGVPQLAVFDTGFHRRLPLATGVYPGPYEWFERGIRRYGFHGISHGYCAARSAQILHKDASSLKIVSCHLGNGCSLAAIEGGRSVDTTMGFSPLEGLMMGTRSGSVDPGILTYLMRQDSLDGQQLDELLNRKSGLLGVSGLSGDMRQIVAAAKDGNARARLAFDMFVHRLRLGIGAMVAVLGGLDVLAFTGGIGENSAEVRSEVCGRFGFLGLELDSEKNQVGNSDREISSEDSKVRVLVVRAREEWAIAQACWDSAHASGM